MGRLIGALQEREESVMALVCHWGVINALTGCDFDNCEVRGFRLSDIAVRGLPEWALVSD